MKDFFSKQMKKKERSYHFSLEMRESQVFLCLPSRKKRSIRSELSTSFLFLFFVLHARANYFVYLLAVFYLRLWKTSFMAFNRPRIVFYDEPHAKRNCSEKNKSVWVWLSKYFHMDERSVSILCRLNKRMHNTHTWNIL